MSTTREYRDKVARLKRELDLLEQSSGDAPEKCIPTMYIAAGIAPVLVFLILWFLSPGFVQKKEGEKYSRSTSKVFMWTLLSTAMLWIGMYVFTYCDSFVNTSICARS